MATPCRCAAATCPDCLGVCLLCGTVGTQTVYACCLDARVSYREIADETAALDEAQSLAEDTDNTELNRTTSNGLSTSTPPQDITVTPPPPAVSASTAAVPLYTATASPSPATWLLGAVVAYLVLRPGKRTPAVDGAAA